MTAVVQGRQAVVLGVLGVLSVAALPPVLGQQTVYRSVDQQGRVTFSAQPPDGPDVRSVEPVRLDPGPSPVDQPETKARSAKREARGSQPPAPADAATPQSANSSRQTADAGKQEADKASPPPRQGAENSLEARADQDWKDLLTNGRKLTSKQQADVDKAAQELIDAQFSADPNAGAGNSASSNRGSGR